MTGGAWATREVLFDKVASVADYDDGFRGGKCRKTLEDVVD